MTDPLDLLGTWDGADLAIVVDAIRSGAAPGTLTIVDLAGHLDTSEPIERPGTTSTHGIGLSGVLRLARAIGRAPLRVVVVGIEGEDFGRGVGLSPAVDAAVPGAVNRVVDLIREVRVCA
jgi:hydrogenase maturation protease